MLYKVRDFVYVGILKAIYHALLCHIFIMPVLYGDRMYAQSIVLHTSKRKHLTHFKERNTYTDSLFFKSKMVKLIPNKVKIENCLQQFISKYVNNKIPPIFYSWFIFSSNFRNYETLFLILQQQIGKEL